jgi:hypothetical protein
MSLEVFRKLAGFLLGFMILLVSSASSQDRTAIPLTLENGRSHVTVRVGDVVIPRILLDTGFAFDGLMIYSPAYRDSLDLGQAVEVKIGGAGTGDAATALMLDSARFQLGDISMKNQRLIVLQGDAYAGFHSNGIIGYSIFGHYVTELDYDDRTLTLHGDDPPELEGQWTALDLYFKENQIPWMDVSVIVESEPPTILSTYIDFAAGDAIVLLERPDQKFRYPTDTTDIYIGRGLSGDIYGRSGTISELIIGPFALKNVKASFADAEVRSKQDNADAVLGHASLSRFNLIFDYARKKLHLRPNRRFGEPF